MPDTALAAPAKKPRIYGAPSLRTKSFDGHTRLFLWMIKKAIKKWKGSLPTFDKVRPPQSWGVAEKDFKPLKFGTNSKYHLKLPTVDEDWPAPDLTRKVLMWVLGNGRIFPINDTDEEWVGAEEARDTFQELLPLGSYMARPYHRWEEMRSDESMSRIAFAGLGALRLMPYQPVEGQPAGFADATWQNDMTFLMKYAVREPFEHYGAKAVFDHDQRPIGIFWSHGDKWVLPQDAEWEHAKWVWRCSLMVGTTIADHLVGVHWMIANYVATAALVGLSPTHYLRLLLKPFTWRTVTINNGSSESLCPEYGFVHRASALTSESLPVAFGDAIELMKFRTVRQLVERKGEKVKDATFPWLDDALKLYEVVRTFVAEYVEAYCPEETTADTAGDLMKDLEIIEFWIHLNSAPASVEFPGRSRESLIDILAQFIWCVTGLHEAVGTVHEYVLDPTFMGTKIRAGREISDVQASIQYLLIMALTGLQMPRLMEIGDAASIYGADFRGRRAFARFHDALAALSRENDEANKTRRWPCQTFNPKNLETGVSI